MLRNYLVIAWRNIVGNPLFSAINIIGLAIGLACCITITLFVRYELSYDRHWNRADDTYRVTRDFFGNNLRLAAVAPPIAPLLDTDFAEIEDIVRILVPGPLTLTVDDEQYREESLVIADPGLLEFFSLDLVDGDAASALARPDNVVLSERAAERYFGSENPVGRTINVMGQVDLTVTAVIADIPDNSHMRFEMIGSIESIPLILGPDELESWGSNNYYTYFHLAPGSDPEALESRFPAFIDRHNGEGASQGTALNLQRLTDIHLNSDRDAEWRENGSSAVVYTFAAVALVVLLIACINFMNLTTARSTQRAREVGVRKVVGANRSQLIAQFLGESVLLTGMAMLLAVALVELTLPFVADFLEKPLEFSLLDPAMMLSLVAGVLLVGILAGSYPAFFLSHFRPADVLKGASASTGSALLRKGLVVFQFAVSVTLLIATGVVIAQMQYARNYDVGYDRSRNIVTSLPFFAPLWDVYEPMKESLERHPAIESVAYSSRLPGSQNLDGSGYVPENRQVTMDNVLGIADIKVDNNWFEHYGIEFIAGGTFLDTQRQIEQPGEEQPVTRGAAVINASAARLLGWSPEEAVGRILRQPMSRELDQFIDREISGVIPDIQFSSLHDERKATVFAEPNANYGRSLSIRLAPGRYDDGIAHFERVWQQIVPSEPARWEFLETRFDALYRSEQRQAQMFAVFSAFAIFVATLGLFGLASFTTERRTKEIGIRKVMGASVRDIVVLLTTDFTKLVLVATLIAWPLGFVVMRDWLTRFVYQAPLSEWAWTFIASAAAALTVAWLTIAAQASRAARARPVHALRYE